MGSVGAVAVCKVEVPERTLTQLVYVLYLNISGPDSRDSIDQLEQLDS